MLFPWGRLSCYAPATAVSKRRFRPTPEPALRPRHSSALSLYQHTDKASTRAHTPAKISYISHGKHLPPIACPRQRHFIYIFLNLGVGGLSSVCVGVGELHKYMAGKAALRGWDRDEDSEICCSGKRRGR